MNIEEVQKAYKEAKEVYGNKLTFTYNNYLALVKEKLKLIDYYIQDDILSYIGESEYYEINVKVGYPEIFQDEIPLKKKSGSLVLVSLKNCNDKWSNKIIIENGSVIKKVVKTDEKMLDPFSDELLDYYLNLLKFIIA